MTRKTTKSFVVKSFSFGKATILKGNEIVEKYRKLRNGIDTKAVSASEIYEIALNIGFEILEKTLIPTVKTEQQFEDTLQEVKTETLTGIKKKPETLADMTDDEFEKMLGDE